VFPDNLRIATAGWDGTVRLWDIDSGNEIRKYKGHAGEAWWVACDSAGKRLLSTGSDLIVRLWDVETGEELQKMIGHRKTPTAAVFLPDGQTAVSASEDWFLKMWDLNTGKMITQRPADKMLYRLSLSPSGRCVLCGCDKSFVRWTPPHGKLQYTAILSSQPVESAVALPDGRVALAIKDGTIRIWDSNLDQAVHQFQSNLYPVMSLAVAPDGRHIASGGRDKIARIWRIPDK
jgi:WD40 repeat protein